MTFADARTLKVGDRVQTPGLQAVGLITRVWKGSLTIEWRGPDILMNPKVDDRPMGATSKLIQVQA